EAEGFRPDLTPQDFQRAQSTLLALEGDFWLYLARERESVMPEKRWETFQKWQNELHPNDPAGFARLQKVARGVGLLDIFSFKTDGIRIKSRVRANQESADYFHDLSLVRDFLISRGFHRVEENNPRGIFLSNLLLKGDGNCVSLSLLFAHFAAMTGRPLQAGLLPRHFYLMGKEGAAIDSVFNYGITHSNAYKNRAIIPEQKALPAHAVLGVHLLNLGKSAMEGGNDARAINAFEHAQALLPRSPRAYLQLGQMAQSRNDFAAALAYYQQVYALHPTDAKGLNNLRVRAWERFQAGQYREAEAAFRRMNDINPQDLNALHGLQTTYQAMGLFAEAEGVGSLIELMKMDDGEP
ncbi:MAG: hypothetical protein K8R69_00530, partial [Deltaproteobacteria bacterium]|nr:hypothetical protein [Deltaproteobacteria bacterium]